MRLPLLCLSIAAALATIAGCGSSSTQPTSPVVVAAPVVAPQQRTIIMVWDGLRPDSVNPTDTPNLYAMRQAGVHFVDNHSTYPTFTMMNGSSFATGSFPKTSGFYGNTFWTPPQAGATPIPVGKSAAGADQDYVAPVFTEDYAVLTTLNDYYGGQLLLVKSLFKTAQDAGLKTATIGKSGAAFIQDLGRGGIFLDENAVLPASLAGELQAASFALPKNTTFAYPAGTVTLAAANGDPTARAGALTFALPNGLLAKDATDTTQGNPEDAANKYMMKVYTDFILPKKLPDLSLIWFRTPDNTEHAYGPGSANYRKALASQDARLGELQAAIKFNGMDQFTNIIVVSDHAHSNVSGPTSVYPLRAINASSIVASGLTNATLGNRDAVNGFSVSGDVRTADLLTYAGFSAYDGAGCSTSAMYGIKADGSNVQPVGVDASGALCGAANTKYQAISASLPKPVASFKVPAVLQPKGIVVAANGGSDYLYLPDHDAGTIAAVVRFLQSRPEYGAVFVDSRYGAIPGTLPMSMINLENAVRSGKGQPDIVVSFNWDAQQLVNGLPGTEFESTGANRGMHGSFSPIDVHNTLIAFGPAFKTATVVSNPSGNVDVAPTVAFILGQSMPQADGRVLNEALAKPASTGSAVVKASVVNPTAQATGLVFKVPTDLTGVSADTALSNGSYSINLMVKDLAVDGKTYRYFDYAQPVRN